ncbi:hypothetical protein [Nostoc sp. C110]
MSRLFAILEKIKAKPGMYIGRPAVSDLFKACSFHFKLFNRFV